MNDIARIPVEGRPLLGAGERGAPEDTGAARMTVVANYLRIAKRWRWVVLGAVGVALFAGLVATLLMTPLYTATATVEIQRESYRIVNVEGVEPKSQSLDMEFYQTQYGLLRSESLAQRVARNLRLHENAAFFDLFGADSIADELRSGLRTRNRAAEDNRIRIASAILLGNIRVSPARASRLVDVGFTGPDPELSARIANQWTRDFIQAALERRFEATSYARRFLEQRLEQLRQRLEESERQLVTYASQQGIVNLQTTTTAGNEGSVTERPLTAETLSAINQELSRATGERVAAESRLRNSGGSTIEALQNPAIAQMRQRRAELAADRARLLTQFEPEYPPARALSNQIDQLDRSIAREESRVGSTLQATYRAAAAREEMLRAQVAQLRSGLLDLRNRSIQYNIYQREVDTNRQLYDALLQRYREIGVAGGVGVNNILVVDAAAVPESPSSPSLPRNLLLALAIGLTLGSSLALALDQIDEAISDPTTLERLLGVPLLGTIPNSSAEDILAELQDPKSPLVEAYLSAQTSLGFTTDHGFPRSLMVTSTRPAEGKSLTSFAFAAMLARTGRRVILVDADMRSPSQHHNFGVENRTGLSNYLAGDNQLAGLILTHKASGVDFLAAGPPPPNAAELLTGDRITGLMKEFAAIYDHVLIDAPPVMGLADAPLIASRMEATVFVVQAHATRSTVVQVALKRLRDAHARVVGALLTKFEAKRAHYGYGYEYGYGYGERGERADDAGNRA